MPAVGEIGAEKWWVRVSGGNASPSAGEDGTVFHSDRGSLVALSPIDGSQLWSLPIADPDESGTPAWGTPIVSAPGIVFSVLTYPNFDRELFAVDTATGSALWSFSIPSPLPPHVAVSRDGKLFLGWSAGIGGGTLMAFEGATGDELWSYPAPAFPRPAIGVDGTVYASFRHLATSTLLAFDPATGDELWCADYGELHASPAVGIDGTVHAGVAFDPLTGERRDDLPGTLSAASSEGAFLVAGVGTVRAIDESSGRAKWRESTHAWKQSTGDPRRPSIALGAGGVVFATDDRGVVALDSAMGESLGVEPRKIGTERQLLLSPDGTLYLPTASRLYAFDVGTTPAKSTWFGDGANPGRTRSAEIGGAPVIIAQSPEQVAVVEGGSVTLSVLVGGDRGRTITWSKDGVEMPQSDSPRLEIAAVDESRVGVYHAEITNAAGSIQTGEIAVRIGHELKLTSIGDGEVALDPPGGVYVPGTSVTASVVGRGQPFFQSWTGAVESAQDSVRVEMNGPRELTATFAPFPGALLWSLQVPGGSYRLPTEPVLGPGGDLYLFVGEPAEANPSHVHSRLWVVDVGERNFRWKSDSLISAGRPAIAENGSVFFGVHPAAVLAFDRVGGGSWQFDPEGRRADFFRSPLSLGDDGTVFTGSSVGFVFAIDPASGRMVWDYRALGTIFTSIAVGESGLVYVGAGDQKLHALEAATGDRRWDFETKASVSSPVVGADGTVFFGLWDKHLYAVDGITGEEKWRTETPSFIDSQPAIGRGGMVVVEVGRRAIHAYAPHSGEELWAFRVDDLVSAPVIGGDGTVYFTELSGALYALTPAGELAWIYRPSKGAWASAPVLGNDGTVYLVAQEQLFAIRGTTELPPLWPSAAGPAFTRRARPESDIQPPTLTLSGAGQGAKLIATWDANVRHVIEQSVDLKTWLPFRELEKPSGRTEISVGEIGGEDGLWYFRVAREDR